VAEYIRVVTGRLAASRRLSFREIFSNRPTRSELVVTFLALLELVKMRMVKVDQAGEFSEIWLSLAVPEEEVKDLALEEDVLGYG